MVRRLLIPVLAAISLLGIGASASALSFVLPPGAVIDDIDFSSNGSASYDGTTLLVTVDADVIRLQGGGVIELGGAGQGSLTLALQLQPTALSSDGASLVLGSFAFSGVDISMIDAQDGVVFEAEFGAGADFQYFQGFPTATLGGSFSSANLGNPFTAALASLSGNLTVGLTGLDPSDIFLLWNGTGLNPFTVQSVTVDYSHAPEPGTAALLALGLLGLAGVRRRSR